VPLKYFFGFLLFLAAFVTFVFGMTAAELRPWDTCPAEAPLSFQCAQPTICLVISGVVFLAGVIVLNKRDKNDEPSPGH
jgi:hypothetical protein